MIGLSDGIEVDDVLASPLPGASRPGSSARHGQFAVGDRVRLIGGASPNSIYYRTRQNGKVVNITSTRIVVEWGDEGRNGCCRTNHVEANLAHVEPAALTRSAISGEAKPS